ncbi:hypothetical protein F4779DRAFT_610505 [Xylariaceae sp. FL0662B]|nr:hypothetical protein F4779DRAFT_610505 [Xylariaceae sp. FL0662B]
MMNARFLKPSKDNPTQAQDQVRRIYKKKLPHFDVAGAELAPIFGLGDSLLAKLRAQSLFKEAAFLDVFVEFADSYLQGRWDMPVGEWHSVLEQVRSHGQDASWTEKDVAGSTNWDVHQFYAHSIIRAMHLIKNPVKLKLLVFWLRDAELEDAYWVLFHALVYLQLETMRDYKHHAPAKDRINHFIAKWKA